MLIIKRSVYDAIIEHSRREAPIEACGLLGRIEGVVSEHYPMINMDNSIEHFSLSPQEQFDVIRKARKSGALVNVLYHSHPESPARPSEEDKKLLADPGYSYVIVSLKEEEPVVRSFRISGGEVKNEDIEVIE